MKVKEINQVIFGRNLKAPLYQEITFSLLSNKDAFRKLPNILADDKIPLIQKAAFNFSRSQMLYFVACCLNRLYIAIVHRKSHFLCSSAVDQEFFI